MSPFSRDFADFYPAVPPSYKSIPYWSPFSSLPPPVFLANAGTLSSTALSLSVSHFLPQTMLSIFPSFLAPVRFICPLITLFLFFNPISSHFGIPIKKVSEVEFCLVKKRQN